MPTQERESAKQMKAYKKKQEYEQELVSKLDGIENELAESLRKRDHTLEAIKVEVAKRMNWPNHLECKERASEYRGTMRRIGEEWMGRCLADYIDKKYALEDEKGKVNEKLDKIRDSMR